MLLRLSCPFRNVYRTLHARLGGREQQDEDIGQVDCANAANIGHACPAIYEHELEFRGPLVPEFLDVETEIVFVEKLLEIERLHSGRVVQIGSACAEQR